MQWDNNYILCKKGGGREEKKEQIKHFFNSFVSFTHKEKMKKCIVNTEWSKDNSRKSLVVSVDTSFGNRLETRVTSIVTAFLRA